MHKALIVILIVIVICLSLSFAMQCMIRRGGIPVNDKANGIVYVWVPFGGYEFDELLTRDVTEYVIPETYKGKPVKKIGVRAFSGCKQLKSIVINDGIKMIDSDAFFKCSELEYAYIGESVEAMRRTAFDECDKLATVYWNVKEFKNHESVIFGEKSKVTNAIIGEKVETLTCVFSTCKTITGINIPVNVKTITSYAFQKCSGLAEITIPQTVSEVGIFAFADCEGLLTATYGNSFVSHYMFNNCRNLKNVILQETVTGIGNCAFGGCESLESIYIPSKVSNIGKLPFKSCLKLSLIQVSEDNANYSSKGGFLFDKAKTRLICVPEGVSGFIAVPDGVTELGSLALYNCVNIDSVSIPETLSKIGSNAFHGCSGLTDIYYKGTIEQWNKIEKGENWNIYANEFKVHCSDGEING